MAHSILALELCLRHDPGLRSYLHGLIREHPPRAGLKQKWELYGAAARALHSQLHLAELGCWDYFNDDARAKKDFDMWSKGMTTEEGARPGPSPAVDPYRGGEPRYMTFTMAFLLLQGTTVDRSIAALCNIPQPNLWHRATFARILGGLGALSFSVVKSDVLYLIPGDPTWALTPEDLRHTKFEYLRRITDG